MAPETGLPSVICSSALRRVSCVAWCSRCRPGATWPLPLYELAFLASEYLAEHMTRGVEIVIVTPEERPLALFGETASRAIAEPWSCGESSSRRQVPSRGLTGLFFSATDVSYRPTQWLPSELEGPRIDGVPQDESGFVATDDLGGVLGLTDVYAAGDLTQSPIKQGGLAAQQADSVATAIAADAGAPVQATPYTPVLRGLLLTGMVPRFLRSEGPMSTVDTQPLWWPPTKIVGRYLSPFLAEHLGLATTLAEPPNEAVPVEVALDTRDHASWSVV